MARLESQAKLGFYPTPPKTQELLCKLIKSGTPTDDNTALHVFDPCCGEGVALAIIANVLRTQGAEKELRMRSLMEFLRCACGGIG